MSIGVRLEVVVIGAAEAGVWNGRTAAPTVVSVNHFLPDHP
jgi:hypothetical protein